VSEQAKMIVTGLADLWVTPQTVRDTKTETVSATAAMNVPGGCLIRTSLRGMGQATQALVYVPHAQVRKQKDSKTGVLVTIP
jgi:hypothetical protein